MNHISGLLNFQYKELRKKIQNWKHKQLPSKNLKIQSLRIMDINTTQHCTRNNDTTILKKLEHKNMRI